MDADKIKLTPELLALHNDLASLSGVGAAASKLPKTKYLAVKIACLPHFVWFKRSKVREEDGLFHGHDGWGEDGALTHLSCTVQAIEARIESEALQY